MPGRRAPAAIGVAELSGRRLTARGLYSQPRWLIRKTAARSRQGLSDEEKRDNVVRLAFGGEPEHLDTFCRAIDEVIPPGTIVVLRGSAVTGHRWKDQAPFDADGPGTSDLDLTLVGAGGLLFFKPTGFFVPGVHSRPLSDGRSRHRARPRAAARAADGDGQAAGEHPGVARHRDPVPRRPARPAVPDAVREARYLSLNDKPLA